MFLEVEEIREIIKQINDGVEAAQREGIICGYPESFTVTKMIDANTITATYPIQNEKEFPNISDKA